MDDFDEQDARIGRVFGGEVADVTPAALATYRDHLRSHLEMPCELTGIEDFDWEEFYAFGPGDSDEYDRLKKTRPSYTDKFKLVAIADEIDEQVGLLVEVRRMSDKRKFILPLADLKATDEVSKAAELLDDYSVWFVNFR